MTQPQILDTPENWDAASENYAESVAPVLMDDFVQEFVNRLDVNNEHVAIEVAAGSGALTAVLAPKVRSLLVTDFSPKMIEINERRMREKGIGNAKFKVMDGMNLSLEDSTFDKVACCFGLMLFPDRAKGFREFSRVLKPGGKAMVSGWAAPDMFEGFKLFLDAIHKAIPDFPEPPSPPPVFSLSNLDKFRSEMEEGGFRDVEVDYVTRETKLDNFAQFWSMLTSGAPPVKMLFDKIGERGKASVHEALHDIIKSRFGNGPVIAVNTATVGVGTVQK
jgi:SAM-dependent methyltransferase